MSILVLLKLHTSALSFVGHLLVEVHVRVRRRPLNRGRSWPARGALPVQEDVIGDGPRGQIAPRASPAHEASPLDEPLLVHHLPKAALQDVVAEQLGNPHLFFNVHL